MRRLCPFAAASLAEDTLGLLSLNRRRQLLDGLAARDWAEARASLTLADLYFLAARYQARFADPPWPSAAATAMHHIAAESDTEPIESLGPVAPDLNGWDSPHLIAIAPYEEFERHMIPLPIMERSSEFKLYLAEYLDRRGIPAAAIGSLAEPVARELLSQLKLADSHDWRSILAVFTKLDDNLIASALPKP